MMEAPGSLQKFIIDGCYRSFFPDWDFPQIKIDSSLKITKWTYGHKLHLFSLSCVLLSIHNLNYLWYSTVIVGSNLAHKYKSRIIQDTHWKSLMVEAPGSLQKFIIDDCYRSFLLDWDFSQIISFISSTNFIKLFNRFFQKSLKKFCPLL